MFKRMAVSAVFTVLFASFSEAKGLEIRDITVPQDSIHLSDTAGTNDSLPAVHALQDPKKGFSDLFINSTAAVGVNTMQLNPLAVNFVEDYVDRFGESLEEMKGWGKPYFDMMDGILTQYGLPIELKYLAVIESQLKANARSWAGAVGPWQFMPATARNMGLHVSKKYDERRDYQKSTHAASKYLTKLYDMYGDWLLVIAAYNGGPGKVNSAIAKSGSRDFWMLQQYLPAESRNHVKKFIATHYIMEGQGGITTLTKAEAGEWLAGGGNTDMEATQAVFKTSENNGTNLKTHNISGRYNSRAIAKYVEMDEQAFNRLNPTLDRTLGTSTNYQMRLPEEKMELFLARKNDILQASVQMLLNPDFKL